MVSFVVSGRRGVRAIDGTEVPRAWNHQSNRRCYVPEAQGAKDQTMTTQTRIPTPGLLPRLTNRIELLYLTPMIYFPENLPLQGAGPDDEVAHDFRPQ